MRRLAACRRRRTIRGSSLAEVVTAAGMATIVLFSVVLALLSGTKSWAQGQGKITAEQDSQQAIRLISMELREAMSVSVDANGNGLSYRLPSKDSNGDFAVPVQWDGVNRRIYYQAGEGRGSIRMGAVGSERTICRNVVLEEPLPAGESRSYRIFTPGAGSITRQLNLLIVTETNGASSAKIHSRIRETIYLRNIPILTQ